ncbi:MAG: STAS domain-containing protein [Anaerolineaceae bacterium]|nr:STAS domain-containing protein [Anaerolineaceae bacterium]
MNVEIKNFKRCDLITLSGRIDSESSPKLEKELGKLTENDHFKFVLDLEKVDFMSSAGLRVLVNVQKLCKKYNRGEIVLASVPKNIFSALDLAGFTSIINIFDETTEAVGHF